MIAGLLVPANGRAELRVDGEVFSFPARYAGQQVTITLAPNVPEIVRRMPIPTRASSPSSDLPNTSTNTNSPAAPLGSGSDNLRRVFTPEDLEVLGP